MPAVPTMRIRESGIRDVGRYAPRQPSTPSIIAPLTLCQQRPKENSIPLRVSLIKVHGRICNGPQPCRWGLIFSMCGGPPPQTSPFFFAKQGPLGEYYPISLILPLTPDTTEHGLHIPWILENWDVRSGGHENLGRHFGGYA